VIRVKFTVDVPAAWNRHECDELTIWAHVELETGVALINGGNLLSSKPGSQPVALSLADMVIAGYDVAGFRRLAVQEAHQSDEACALCARRQALLVGTYCGSCTASDGELPTQQARELAALLVTELHQDGAKPELKRAAEALFSHEAARDMRAPSEEATAAQ
jgi:hypothetical protein